MSAGQRQRLAIARAFLAGGPVMLLDEPTARLDLHSERVLVDAAARLLAGRTAVLVAHRPALLRVADRVLRLEGGGSPGGPGWRRREGRGVRSVRTWCGWWARAWRARRRSCAGWA